MEAKIKVNESIARLFFNQIMGQYTGHMSMIPNNPTLKSICESCGVVNEKDFQEFLVKVSENLPLNDFDQVSNKLVEKVYGVDEIGKGINEIMTKKMDEWNGKNLVVDYSLHNHNGLTKVMWQIEFDTFTKPRKPAIQSI